MTEITVTLRAVGAGPPAAVRLRHGLKLLWRTYRLKARWPDPPPAACAAAGADEVKRAPLPCVIIDLPACPRCGQALGVPGKGREILTTRDRSGDGAIDRYSRCRACGARLLVRWMLPPTAFPWPRQREVRPAESPAHK